MLRMNNENYIIEKTGLRKKIQTLRGDNQRSCRRKIRLCYTLRERKKMNKKKEGDTYEEDDDRRFR